MELRQALELQTPAMITLVGAGGKTTTLFRLAAEGLAAGWRVISTTTTHIFEPLMTESRLIIIEADAATAVAAASQHVQRYRHVTVAAGREEKSDAFGRRRLIGLAPDTVDQLRTCADLILVEGDGARGHSFKIPAEHEPVVPVSSDLFMVVVGADAIGVSFDSNVLHRSDLFASWLHHQRGLSPGEERALSVALLARLLTRPDVSLKGRPAGARPVLLINKVEDEDTRRTARQLAATVMALGGYERVLLAAVARDDPVVEVVT